MNSQLNTSGGDDVAPVRSDWDEDALHVIRPVSLSNACCNAALAFTENDRKHPLFTRFWRDMGFSSPYVETSFRLAHADASSAYGLRKFHEFERCDLVILFVSVSSVNSEWFEPTFSTYYRDTLQSRGAILCPIRLDDTPLPNAISSVASVDLFRDYTTGMHSLLSTLPAPEDAPLFTFQANNILLVASTVNDGLVSYLATHPEELRTFDRRAFEELIAHLFKGFGYDVELTKQTRDGGRDIVAISNALVRVKYLIECKRPDPGHLVGIRPVRELYGVLEDEQATKAILATTTHFTSHALQFFERHAWRMEPKDFDDVLSWIKDYQQDVSNKSRGV